MVQTIYDKTGYAKAEIAPDDSSTQVKEVQGDNILTLSFTHYANIALDVNDYTDFEGERYWLMEKYAPKQNSETEWVYDLKLYGIESIIKRFLVLETTDGNAEPVFTLTAPPRDHVKMIVKCINDGLDHTTDWKIGQVDGTDNIVIDYEGKYCDEALKEIAEKVGGKVEWWIEGQTVNICRCEHGEELAIGYGNGLTELERDTSNTAKFYTRLFPIGSTRNIDPEKYGHNRLMLPGGLKYIELHTEEYGIYDHYEQDAFSDIYPRRLGLVSSVRSETKTDDDGNPFIIYYFKDDTLNFDPNEYELANEVKRVSFQDGELAGLGTDDDHYFEVNFDSKTREFEIITIWPYDDDTQLPGGNLVPKEGNHYILWNIRMPDEYYTLAEEEFRTAVDQYNAEHWQDISIYKGKTDHVWVEQINADLFVGRRVRLESEKFFPDTGYRSSRITKITRKVVLPSQVDLEISDALQSGTMDRMNDSLANIKNYTRERTSGSLPDIIRTWDNTLPTDTNLFSARRSQREFLSKKKIDRAKKKIIFDEGIDLGDFVEGVAGGHLDGKGNGELLTMVVRQLLRSAKFVDGFNGEGWQLWIDESGLSNLTVDKLTVRQIMTIFELLINKVRSVDGQICVSAANGKIKSVEEQDGYFLIHFEQENTFVAHDLMRCQTFTGANLKSYWVEVAGMSDGGILVAKEEFDNTEPAEGDECVLMGNTTNGNRQNLILISATEDGQPRIDVMDGVNGKSFTNALRARLGNLDGIKDDWFPSNNQPHGNGLYSDNAYLRGTFLLVTGEDIKTKFEITEGKIESAVEGLRQDFASDRGYLNNPSFSDGMDKWATENETVFFLAGNRWIWTNGKALSKRGNSASVCKDMGRTVVRIRNKYISQKNTNLQSIPPMTTREDGTKEAIPVFLTFFYRCAKAGTLTVEFENVDKTGFENFNSMHVEEKIAETDGYKQYSCNGLWNGTGDFKLSFTGDIYLYMLILSTDRVESLAYKYKTLFEQSEKLVRIAAQNFDQDGNVLEESDIITSSKYNELISQRFNEDGSLRNQAGLVTTSDFQGWLGSEYASDIKSLNEAFGNYVSIESFAGLFATAVEENTDIVKKADISAFVTKDENGNLESGVHISADNIKLEGIVTANENFKILEDGSIVAKSGTFEGLVNATSGCIGGFTIEGNGLTNDKNFDGDAYIILRNDSQGAFAGIGGNLLPASSGLRAVARFQNENKNRWFEYDNLGQNYAMVLSAKNADRNIALSIMGGCIEGFALKTNIVSTTDYKLDRNEGVVAIYNETLYDMTFILPDMEWYDEGHQVTLAVAAMSAGYYSFAIKPGYCYDKSGKKHETFIHWKTKNYTLDSFTNGDKLYGYDTITLMYVPRWQIVNNNAVLQKGMWIVTGGNAQ